MKILLEHKFEDIFNIENLLLAWQEFLNGKRNKHDVREFQLHLMDNILSLRNEVASQEYRHGKYECFKITDPKARIIHKASVKDRLLHHAVYRKLYPFFDKIFISDSFSCRIEKGTHKALKRFRKFSQKVSLNNTETCWILKCDIKKFFASINQEVLIKILKKHIPDQRIINSLKEIIYSFNSGVPGIGVPLGNLTSQLFSNVYLNELDQFVKHKLKIKYYIRYADDFVIFSRDKKYLENLLIPIADFLEKELKLILHPDKIFISTLASGVDFLGWKNFFNYRILRKSTKLRLLKNVGRKDCNNSLVNSYFGLLKHGNAGKIKDNAVKIILRSKY
jgi:retron-type reverse transcriptase